MKYIVFLFVALSLSACSTLPEQLPEETSWKARQAELTGLQHWFVSGRVAIQNGVESWHVNLLWLQQADVYQIRLFGPFGAGQVQLKGNAAGAELLTSDEEYFVAQDVDQLLYEKTGVKMPVSALRYWMLGLPAPNGQDKKQINGDGRLLLLQQSDWKVRYKRYTAVNGLALPKKIFARRHDLDVRVVIDKWELGVPTDSNPFNEPG